MRFNVNYIQIIMLDQMQFNKYILEKFFIKKTDGIVVTNSYFSQKAIELAKKVDIELWDRDKLKKLL